MFVCVSFSQDINMYKGQVLDLQDELAQAREELSTLQKKTRRTTMNQDMAALREQLGAAERALAERTAELDQSRSEYAELQHRCEQQEGRIEAAENDLQHARKKYESLASEKGILVVPRQEYRAYAMHKGHSLQDIEVRPYAYEEVAHSRYSPMLSILFT